MSTVDVLCLTTADGTMHTQGCSYYYGPLYAQGLAPDYLPGRHQAASQRQAVTGTGTRPSSSQNEPSFLASVTLKVINQKNFVLRPSCDIETPQKLREEIVKQYGDQVPHTNDFEVGYFRGQQKV